MSRNKSTTRRDKTMGARDSDATPSAEVNRDSRQADEFCQRARLFYAEGQLEKALDHFNQARALKQLSSEEAIFALRTEYRLNNHVAALKTIGEILADQPRQSEALKTGGRIANVLQDAVLANDFWRRLADAEPSDPDGPLQMARITFRDNAFADAVLWGRRLLSIAPDHPEGLAITASAAVRLNLAGNGEILARYFDVDRVRALALLQQLSRTGDPQNYADALFAVRERLSDDLQIAQIVADAREYFMVNGLQAEIQSRDLEAAKSYRAIRRLDPGNANAEKGLERLRRYAIIKMREGFRLKQDDQVTEHGGKAVEIDPECFEAWMTLGRTHLLANDFAKSRDCFGNCIRINPGDVWAWLNYGRTLDRVGDWKGALEAYRRVVAFGPATNVDYVTESERAIRSLYAKALFAGRDAAARDDIETAWKHCAVAIDIEPENENVAVLKKQLLNRMYLRIRELWQVGSADVIDVCRPYLERVPDDAYVLQVFGRTLMNNRRFAEARSAWEQLARLQSDDPHFRLQIARCCNWLKHRADGIAAAQEVLRLEPGQTEATAILKQLEALPQS